MCIPTYIYVNVYMYMRKWNCILASWVRRKGDSNSGKVGPPVRNLSWSHNCLIKSHDNFGSFGASCCGSWPACFGSPLPGFSAMAICDTRAVNML